MKDKIKCGACEVSVKFCEWCDKDFKLADIIFCFDGNHFCSEPCRDAFVSEETEEDEVKRCNEK